LSKREIQFKDVLPGMHVKVVRRTPESGPAMAFTRKWKGVVGHKTPDSIVFKGYYLPIYADHPEQITLYQLEGPRMVDWYLISNLTTNDSFVRFWNGNGWCTSSSPSAHSTQDNTPSHWKIVGPLVLQEECND
jgi:hypothetical protein